MCTFHFSELSSIEKITKTDILDSKSPVCIKNKKLSIKATASVNGFFIYIKWRIRSILTQWFSCRRCLCSYWWCSCARRRKGWSQPGCRERRWWGRCSRRCMWRDRWCLWCCKTSPCHRPSLWRPCSTGPAALPPTPQSSSPARAPPPRCSQVDMDLQGKGEKVDAGCVNSKSACLSPRWLKPWKVFWKVV